MIYLRWTGHGYLMPLLVIVIGIAGLRAGHPLAGRDDVWVSSLVMAGVMVLLAPLHWLLGLALNSERTPSGRRWHDRHTIYDVPLQYGFHLQLVVAWILVSVALGQVTFPLYGWLLFGGVPAAALAVYAHRDRERLPLSTRVGGGFLLVSLAGVAIEVGRAAGPRYGWLMFAGVPLVVLLVLLRRSSRRQLRSVADRKTLAAERGWLYRDRAADLALRWKDLLGRRAAYTVGPFGVLAGEASGLPFTAFDSEPGEPASRLTYWAVHLPVAYPRVQVHGKEETFGEWANQFSPAFSAFVDGGPSALTGSLPPPAPTTPDDLRAETAEAAFGQALLTPQVRATTVALGLVGWCIEGRDLLLTRQPGRPHTAEDVEQVALRLIGLARQLPADLADRFGSPPSTDVPLRKGQDGDGRP